eukprot:TRINITY_DN797_c0_g1_i2.p1 TRINITY_DN797_c0_g1~~TRINITY_DN797_c0_g1_i2.p1  ORF type:complete len:285 (-),score=55.09 TRINITY_DN797_c0_g1_i2:86-940(-)
MESAAMSMSLDDIISTKSKPRGGGRGGRGGRSSIGKRDSEDNGGRGAFRRSGEGSFRRQSTSPYQASRQRTRRTSEGGENGVWQHDMFDDDEDMNEEVGFSGRGRRGGSVGGEAKVKVHVDNLDFGVSEADLRDLFSAATKAVIIYNKAGRSEGSAQVTFSRKSDAVSAINKYNGVALDGRELRLTLIGGNNNDAAPSRGSSGGIQKRLGGFAVNSRSSPSFERRNRGDHDTRDAPRRAQGTGRVRKPFGATRGGRGGRRNGSDRMEDVSAEDLDAELEEYQNQ